jgi:hypothetical protein
MRNPLKVIATVGLALGGVFGIAGTMVSPPLQAILWAIDGAGLVMATVLLTIKCFRTGNDVVAGGFLVFAIGEGVVLSSAAADPESGIRSFAAGITLWGTALLLVSVPRLFALPVRIIGIVSAILFILTAARIFMGEQLLPTSTPFRPTLIHFWWQHSSAGSGCYGDPRNWTAPRVERVAIGTEW